ncbi:MAG: hypothetical protein E7518_10960 [Ruminococcaceae bacterium]|nr:hypothetical protein [Oscillospiraceae bacterium]
MKKITGKVVSLVLALALVVTSFSGISAFAYSKTVEGRVDLAEDEIYLVNGGDTKEKRQYKVDLLKDKELTALDRTQSASDVEVSSISHASGDSLVRWDIDGTNVTFTLRDSKKSGKEVLSVLVKGSYPDDDDNKITVKVKKEYTIHVLDADKFVIGKKDSGYEKPGDEIDELDSFAQTAGSKQQACIYQPMAGEDAKATYDVKTNLVLSDEGELNNQIFVDISNDTNIHATVDDNGVITMVAGRQPNDDGTFGDDASTGNVTITATSYDENGKKDDDTKTTFKGKIEKKVDVATLVESMKKATEDPDSFVKDSFVIEKADKGGSTVLEGINNKYLANADEAAKDVVVTNAEVVFPDGTKSVSVGEKSNLQKISGTVGALSVGDASVNTIDVKGSVSITGDKASIGDITAEAEEVMDGEETTTYAGVSVEDGKTGNITVKDSDLKIAGGTIGNVEMKDDATTVTIEPSDDETAITVGDIKTKRGLTISSVDSAKVSVGNITVTDDSDVTLVGNKVTLKSVDFDYYVGRLALGDTDEFVGTVPSLKNAINTTIDAQEEDTDAVINGNVNVDAISVDDDAALKFTDKVDVNTIDGDGTLAVAAGKLYVDGSASGVTLKLTDANIANGMVAYTAKADALDVDDMNNFGFTVAKSAGNSIDTFKINGLTFAGVQVNKTSARIAKDYSETFTATAYPTGTTIPTDAKIAWELDGNDDVFQVTATGNTATVKVLRIDSDFASENEATLTAKLVDEDGDEIDDYASAEIALTAIAVPDAKSDTTTNFTVAQGASYTMKVTSATAPSVTLGTAGVFAVTTTKNGNDYFYKFVPTGKVGAATGVYLNGTKLLVASVGAPAFKSDTTVAIKVAAGKSYTYKITASAAPSFVFGTGNVFSVTKISKVGNDYFFTVAPVANAKSGAATGVYVNGVKVNVATVA